MFPNTRFASNLSMSMKMSKNPAKYEVLIKQYLCSILDISESVDQYLHPSELMLAKQYL